MIQRKQKSVVAILGGGITSLSTAYYLTKNYNHLIHPIIIEKSNRLGGWLKTVQTPSGTKFEMGPRTIRPVGLSGMNTLDLIEDLKLHTEVLYVEKDHPTARNRFVYAKGKLCRLPHDITALYKRQDPFSRALGWAIIRDLVNWRKRLEDDSIHNFVSRRFGPECADYLIDPLISGICAGDSKSISVKFLMKQLFEYEQTFGSVLLGFAASKLKKTSKQAVGVGSSDPSLPEHHKSIGFSNIAGACKNWSVWTLEQGLESLANKLESEALNKNVQIMRSATVTSLNMDREDGQVEVVYNVNDDPKKRDKLVCNHVVSTVNGATLGNILKNSRPNNHPELWGTLTSIPTVDLQVTGVRYKDPELIIHNGFGFLVPSKESHDVGGLLGVVFDTNSFPQSNPGTVLTIMSRSNSSGESVEEEDISRLLWYLEKTLGIKEPPLEYHTEMMRQAIPQYTVGHYEKVDKLKKYLVNNSRLLPLTLAGASYDGVSVNDCILSGRNAAYEVGEKVFEQQSAKSSL